MPTAQKNMKKAIQNRLNHRPRKVLGYKTPYEVFFSEMSKKLAS